MISYCGKDCGVIAFVSAVEVYLGNQWTNAMNFHVEV